MKRRTSRFTLLRLFVGLFVLGVEILLGQPKPQHIVLVIIDGARYSETLADNSAQYAPFMHQLAMKGAIVDTMLNDGVTITRRAIPAIWSGSWSVPIDTVLNGSMSTQYASAPTVWEYLRKERGFDSTQAVYILKQLNSPWLPSYHPDYGPNFWPWYILHGNTDIEVWEHAKTILETYHPVLTVLYLADVDHAGHSGNWLDYTNAIGVADSIINEVWNLLENDLIFKESSTLFVTNDHGRHSDGISTGFSGHGDGCWGCRQVMLLAVGTMIRKGLHSETPRSITDIVPTIGSMLQFPTAYATGSPMKELFMPVVSVEDTRSLPQSPSLQQNYPNPFNPSTTIRYGLPFRSRVRLTIFNMLGQLTATLADEEVDAGYYQIQWNPGVVSGLYFYRLEAVSVSNRNKRFVDVKKMILLK